MDERITKKRRREINAHVREIEKLARSIARDDIISNSPPCTEEEIQDCVDGHWIDYCDEAEARMIRIRRQAEAVGKS